MGTITVTTTVELPDPVAERYGKNGYVYQGLSCPPR